MKIDISTELELTGLNSVEELIDNLNNTIKNNDYYNFNLCSTGESVYIQMKSLNSEKSDYFLFNLLRNDELKNQLKKDYGIEIEALHFNKSAIESLNKNNFVNDLNELLIKYGIIGGN